MPGSFVFKPDGVYSKRIAYLERKKAEAKAKGEDFDPLNLGNPKLHPAHKPPTPVDPWHIGGLGAFAHGGGWGQPYPSTTAPAPAVGNGQQNAVYNSADYPDPITLAAQPYLDAIKLKLAEDDAHGDLVASDDESCSEESSEEGSDDHGSDASDEKNEEHDHANMFIMGSAVGFVAACLLLCAVRRI